MGCDEAAGGCEELVVVLVGVLVGVVCVLPPADGCDGGEGAGTGETGIVGWMIVPGFWAGMMGATPGLEPAAGGTAPAALGVA